MPARSLVAKKVYPGATGLSLPREAAERPVRFKNWPFGYFHVGVFQWYAGPRGDCVNGGAACSGPYYQQYGLAWRENLWLDIDRAASR